MVLPKRKNGGMKALPYRQPSVGKNRVRELAPLHLSEETGGVFVRRQRERPQSKAGHEARPRGSLGPRSSFGKDERHQPFAGWRPDRDRDWGARPLLPRYLTPPESGPAKDAAAPWPAAEGYDRGRKRLRRGRG